MTTAPKQQQPTTTLDYAKQCIEATDRAALAEKWSVSPDVLKRFGIGYDADRETWTVPTFDGAGELHGVYLPKSHEMVGLRGGLAKPSLSGHFPINSEVTYVTEGVCDAACLLELGRNAIGRITPDHDEYNLIELLERYGFTTVVICHDAHEHDSFHRLASLCNAITLANNLARNVPQITTVRVIEPPRPHQTMHDWYLANDARAAQGELLRLCNAAREWCSA